MDITRNSFSKGGEHWKGLIDSLLLSYSQIFFSKDRWVGLILLIATSFHGDLFLCGLIAVLLANGFALALRFNKEFITDGLYGYNALLIGLALPTFFEMNTNVFFLLGIAVLATVLLTVSLQTLLNYYFNLPVLTVPFLTAIYLILASFPMMRGVILKTDKGISLIPSFLPEVVESYFRSLGAIFFSPEWVCGGTVFLALLLFSRIATILSFIGFAIGAGLAKWVFTFPSENLYLSIGFNFILTSIALGGIWFIPQVSSFLFAGYGVLLSGIILAGSAHLFSLLNLPVLILPFNLTVLILIYGMRQRILDRYPKSVDFFPGTPEVNMTYYRTRLARFGANFMKRISLPFLGTWICTQGHEGGPTHQGLWKHGFDFEVQDSSGRPYKNEGKELTDYLCYRLPILACADGQVVKTIDHIPENPVGDPNLNHNWGNLVLIRHGFSLFSMVCHLAEGSLKVKEGDFVRRGEVIGLCGNSGRSLTPHLHFQLQNTGKVGAPTIHSEFHEVVLESSSPMLHSTYVPKRGDRLRNIRRQDEIANTFNLPIGQRIDFTCSLGNRSWREVVELEIDLYGNLKLVSLTEKAHLYFENREDVFVILDFQGTKKSALFILYVSAPRVPYEYVETLTFTDILPSRYFFSWNKRILLDFLSPFSGLQGLKVQYHCSRRNGELIISGKSLKQQRSGKPFLETEAIFREGRGWRGGYLLQDGEKFQATLTDNSIAVQMEKPGLN